MNHLAINSKELVKIVSLPPLKVISFHVVGSQTPEIDSWNLVQNWLKINNALDFPQYHQIFGFNNPPPSDSDPLYGYEFWITIYDDFEPMDNVNVKYHPGGLYAVLRVKGADSITPSWLKLLKIVNESPYTSLTGREQTLENHIVIDTNNLENMILDLYLPISE